MIYRAFHFYIHMCTHITAKSAAGCYCCCCCSSAEKEIELHPTLIFLIIIIVAVVLSSFQQFLLSFASIKSSTSKDRSTTVVVAN